MSMLDNDLVLVNTCCISISRTCLDHDGVIVSHTLLNQHRFDSLAKTPSTHSSHFRWHSCNIKIANAYQLHINDTWLPFIRKSDLACIEKHRLGLLAFFLLFAWLFEQVSNKIPEWITMRGTLYML